MRRGFRPHDFSSSQTRRRPAAAALTRLRARHLAGRAGGMVSICSVHPMVLGAAMALHVDQDLLIEVTPNQVNHKGGYSGMTPAEFRRFLLGLARDNGFSDERLIMGADHLGPHVWRHLDARSAMAETAEMVRQGVAAGFQKLHLDTAVPCADDPGPVLPLETIAGRAAHLCQVAEQAAGHRAAEDMPVYVIGRDVPQPGGGLDYPGAVQPTPPHELDRNLAVYEEAFHHAGLHSAWQRVLAVVVQPGVDFNDRQVAPYRPERAADLSACHDRLPGIMTFEAHATDYQSPEALARMVRDHFTLLKMGPCLTFALRQILYALAALEAAWDEIMDKSRLPEVMESLMMADPQHLTPRQRGPSAPARRLRHTGRRDRIRYYWNQPLAKAAVERLLDNLSRPIPRELLQRYLPDPDPDLSVEAPAFLPRAVISRYLQKVLEPYFAACRNLDK